MKEFAALQRRLIQELNASDRLRYGFYAICSLLSVWIWLVLADHNVELKRSLQMTSARLADLRSVASQEVWEQRQREESQVAQRLQNLLWVSETENQTLAAIQSTIRGAVQASGLNSMSVTVGSPQWHVEGQALKQVRTRVRARGQTNDALKLVALLEDHQPQFVVEGLSIEVLRKPGSGGNRISVDALAYFLSDEKSP